MAHHDISLGCRIWSLLEAKRTLSDLPLADAYLGRAVMNPITRYLRVLAATGTIISLTGALPTASYADNATFRLGQSAPANTFLAIWMADDAGFYQANGLKLEIVPMAGGRDMADAFAKDRIDAMHIGLSSVVRANGANADLRAFGSLSNVIRFALFGKPGVKSPDDLKGGTIAISSLGSESDATLPLMLGKIGLTRADVQIKELGIQRLSAVQSGSVTATAVNEPDRSRAYAAGLPALVDLATQRIPWLFTGLVAKRTYISDNRDTVIRFLKATIQGNRLAISDEQHAKAVLKKQFGTTDQAVIDISYADFKEQTPPNVEIDIDAARTVVAQIAKPDASHDLNDYIDTSLLGTLKAEGYFR
jgi:ABC-type nitrate/sulfonate/bicarbonate transport system substrate-binding protein